MVAKYYKALEVLREDQRRIRGSTAEAIGQMRGMQDKVIAKVLKKQRETQVFYERRYRSCEREVRDTRRRLVEARNRMIR